MTGGMVAACTLIAPTFRERSFAGGTLNAQPAREHMWRPGHAPTSRHASLPSSLGAPTWGPPPGLFLSPHHYASHLRRTRQLNVQAGTQFCDAAFQAEVASGRLSSSSLDTYACVALAGVATEWLRFGRAEGGLADVQQLDRLLQALRFSQVGPTGGWSADVNTGTQHGCNLLHQRCTALSAPLERCSCMGSYPLLPSMLLFTIAHPGPPAGQGGCPGPLGGAQCGDPAAPP